MSTAKTKKKIRRRLKGSLRKRRRSGDSSQGLRRRGGTAAGRTKTAAGRPTARRERTNARASLTASSSPKVSKSPALTGQSASSSSFNRANSEIHSHRPKQATASGKPKRDFATGRTLFPVESSGKTQYLPIASEASPHEQKLGLFVSDDSVQKDAVNKLLKPDQVKQASVRDFNTGRTLFATQTADGKREYLPKKSEATALELSQGKYVSDDQVEVPSVGNQILNQRPVFEFSRQRSLFATQTTNGKREYLPKKSEATAFELSQGRYINDDDISAQAPVGAVNAMSNRPPRYDIGRSRQVFAVDTPEGTRYLPRESEAGGLELVRGLFIPDDIVDLHEQQRRRTALQNNSARLAQRRAKRAARLPAGRAKQDKTDRHQTRAPATKATDGTALWDGSSPPTVSDEKQKKTLASLRPKYDVGKNRWLYPAEIAQGKIQYLPLIEDASSQERVRGLYAAFVPPESLGDFLAHAESQGTLTRQTFTAKKGEVEAYSQADIEDVLEAAPTLVLRSAQLVSDRVQAISALQQHSIQESP